jgi:V/A-type H+-transporting ATPase subunit B
MRAGIGPGRTREDHRAVADQLYACFARGRELRQLTAIIGEAALSDEDRRYRAFAEDFEQRFVGQSGQPRTLEQTLDRAWELLARFPAAELKRVKPDLLDCYHRPRVEEPT